MTFIFCCGVMGAIIREHPACLKFISDDLDILCSVNFVAEQFTRQNRHKFRLHRNIFVFFLYFAGQTTVSRVPVSAARHRACYPCCWWRWWWCRPPSPPPPRRTRTCRLCRYTRISIILSHSKHLMKTLVFTTILQCAKTNVAVRVQSGCF